MSNGYHVFIPDVMRHLEQSRLRQGIVLHLSVVVDEFAKQNGLAVRIPMGSWQTATVAKSHTRLDFRTD